MHILRDQSHKSPPFQGSQFGLDDIHELSQLADISLVPLSKIVIVGVLQVPFCNDSPHDGIDNKNYLTREQLDPT